MSTILLKFLDWLASSVSLTWLNRIHVGMKLPTDCAGEEHVRSIFCLPGNSVFMPPDLEPFFCAALVCIKACIFLIPLKDSDCGKMFPSGCCCLSGCTSISDLMCWSCRAPMTRKLFQRGWRSCSSCLIRICVRYIFQKTFVLQKKEYVLIEYMHAIFLIFIAAKTNVL